MRTVEITADEYAACRRSRGTQTLREISRHLRDRQEMAEGEIITGIEPTDTGVRVSIDNA